MVKHDETTPLRRDEESDGSHNIPLGHWRDGLCDWYRWPFHPHFCLTLWFPSCALGQVLTRMKLNALAKPRNERAWSAFKLLFVLTAAYMILQSVINSIVDSYEATTIYDGGDHHHELEPPGSYDEGHHHHDEVETPGSNPSPDRAVEMEGQPKEMHRAGAPWGVGALAGFGGLMQTAFWLFMLVVTMRLRTYIRRKYNIPEQSCNGYEDFCCSLWCNPCTICQLGRHTADYHKYDAAFCTETGLVHDAPEVV